MRSIFKNASSRRGFLRASAIAGLIVACDPMGPDIYGTCEDLTAHCSTLEYTVEAWARLGPDLTRDSTGAFQVDTLPVIFSVQERRAQPLPKTACAARGTAWALSCAGCSSYFEGDSISLTTDWIGPAGDTLKAGSNLVGRAPASGMRVLGEGGGFSLDSGSFRDTAFEVRFHGKVGDVAKSATARVKIRGAGLVKP